MATAPQWVDGARRDDAGPFGFVLRIWRGQAPLATVFWLYGVLGTAALGALFWRAQVQGNLVGQQGLLLLAAIYTVWILGAIWRSAWRAGHDYFHGSARALTIAWAINAVLLLGGAEVELVGRWLS